MTQNHPTFVITLMTGDKIRTKIVVYFHSGIDRYLAPEYFMYGNVDDKVDVYAFGVVLLKLLSGRKPISNEYPKGQESLVMCDREIDGVNEQLEEDVKALKHIQLQLLQERSKRSEVGKENTMLQNQVWPMQVSAAVNMEGVATQTLLVYGWVYHMPVRQSQGGSTYEPRATHGIPLVSGISSKESVPPTEFLTQSRVRGNGSMAVEVRRLDCHGMR
ncbi:hypothetical protein Sjap_003117 [Stephania japonica]|uniref:Protein kinase domain-containing protein n=1 Tax=Stephania japonica TaxID=461633 RepID=A0AAP0KN45_9MAGN